MTIDLGGRVALVTGASRGIGEAVARRLAEAGATVAVHYRQNRRRAEALAAELGTARAFAADLAEPGAAQALFDAVRVPYGRVDVVVANAGVFEPAPIDGALDGWLAAWDRTLAVNLRSVGELGRAAARHAAERAGDADANGVAVRFVAVASRAAFRGDDPDFLAYAASKGGVVALVKSLARAGGGLAAFAVAPGFTRTDMARAALTEGEGRIVAEGALARLTEPDDVAPAVALFASGLMDHATGATLDVNAASYVR